MEEINNIISTIISTKEITYRQINYLISKSESLGMDVTKELVNYDIKLNGEDAGKNGNEFIFVETSRIQKNGEDSGYYVNLTDIRLTHIHPKKVECLKGHKIRLYKDFEKELLKFAFCEYELNIGTYHPFLLSKKCYFNDFYEKDNHTYTCFTAEDGRGGMYPFEIKDYLYMGQDVIFKFEII